MTVPSSRSSYEISSGISQPLRKRWLWPSGVSDFRFFAIENYNLLRYEVIYHQDLLKRGDLKVCLSQETVTLLWDVALVSLLRHNTTPSEEAFPAGSPRFSKFSWYKNSSKQLMMIYFLNNLWVFNFSSPE